MSKKQAIPPAIADWVGLSRINRGISLTAAAVLLVFCLWAVVHLGHPAMTGHVSASAATWTKN